MGPSPLSSPLVTGLLVYLVAFAFVLVLLVALAA
jgi:hypothetical protein